MNLLEPAAYPHPVKHVQVIETSLSWVILAGGFAYKIKRPVRLPYVDMRSAKRRYQLCRQEVRLNRRFAREWYLRVVPITSSDGRAYMGGDGRVIEHAVQMRAFPAAELLDALVATGGASTELLSDFGRRLARAHDTLARVSADAPWCTPQRVRESVLQNWQECANLLPRDEAPELDLELRTSLERRLEEASELLDRRRAAGFIRECHGDLHAGNLFRHHGRLVAFDCIEFEPAFRWIDVADEIAFLWMDLRARNAADPAAAFLSAYLGASGDYEACRLLPLYGAHRAMVRAKVAAARWAERPHPDQGASHQRIGEYLAEAHRISARPVGTLVLVSGLSGSGKTFLSTQLAQAHQALHLRSDVERKRLAGLGEHQHSRSAVGAGLYTPEMNAKVYSHLSSSAESALRGGFTTIVDAAFLRRGDRDAFQEMASRINARAVWLECVPPLAVLRERIEARAARGHDASEAGIDVLESQIETREAPDDRNPAALRIDTSSSDALQLASRAMQTAPRVP